jgi:hypothetical protein
MVCIVTLAMFSNDYSKLNDRYGFQLESSPVVSEQLSSQLEIAKDSDSRLSSKLQFEKVDAINVFSDEGLPFSPSSISALLFQESLQRKPIYWLVFEFNPPDQSLANVIDVRFPKSDLDWFVQSKSSGSGRLSSWKDGNSLYASKITYS